MSIRYIGLDFETSGTDPWGDAVPIQLGMWAADVPFARDIGRWDWSEFTWSEESFAIHGITKEVLASAPPVWQVDIRAANFLLDRDMGSRMWNVIVGWNVAGFDRQFITRWMPNLNRLLSYRTVDLNALVFAKAGDNEGAYQDIKVHAKGYAADKIGGPENWHDAAYDARAAIYSLEFLTEVIR